MHKKKEQFTCILIFSVTLVFVFMKSFSIKLCNEHFQSKEFYFSIAVIVEFRSTDHSQENEHFIRISTLAPWISWGKILLHVLDRIYDKNQISLLLTSAQFWLRIPGEKILFFQLDSIMCSNSPHKITDYLQYYYIGAPWRLLIFYLIQN